MCQNKQKKIAVINDFSGFGRCSITVALPIISAMKIQCCPVPTAIFSNHTGYREYFFDDYTDRMEAYLAQWKKLNLHFDGICTGFLGSADQIAIVESFLQECKTGQTLAVIDPVMGDDGRLYSTYTPELAGSMKRLIRYADIVTPNLTEACMLTDTPFTPEPSAGLLERMCRILSEQGAKKIVLSGIQLDNEIGNYIYQPGQKSQLLRTPRQGNTRAGTGDVFSAIIAGDAVNGLPFAESVKKAAEFIQKAITYTNSLDVPETDGICFEEFLWELSSETAKA